MTSPSEEITFFRRVATVILQIAFVVIGPFVVARFLLQWSQVNLPLVVHVVILIVCFVVLLGWAWVITGERGEQFYKRAYEIRLTWPFLFFSFSLFLFSLQGFASLTSTLSDLGYVWFEPQIPRGDLSTVQDFYAGHFLKSIPSLNIPDTLMWETPFYEKYLELAPNGSLAPAVRSIIDQIHIEAEGRSIVP